jgi:hypothetical protein
MKRGVITVVGGVIAVALLVFAFTPGDSSRQNLQLSFTGLPSLGGGYYYEGWAVVDGEAWSAGKFDVAADGTLVDLEGVPVKDGVYGAGIDLSEATVVAITIHPPNDDRGPAAPHVIGGSVAELEADLSATSPHAFGTDFSSGNGMYIMDGVSADLTFRLPVLIAGFEYEAWSLDGGSVTSLGRFGGAPPNHGEAGHDHEHDHAASLVTEGLLPHDLSVTDVQLRSTRLLLTVEPADDNDVAVPFGIRILEGRVAAVADDGVQYQLGAAELPLPVGHATVR